MKTPEEITELLKAAESQLESIKTAHGEMWTSGTSELKRLVDEHTQLQQRMQNEGGQNQLNITRLEGMIVAYKNLLSEPCETPAEPSV